MCLLYIPTIENNNVRKIKKWCHKPTNIVDVTSLWKIQVFSCLELKLFKDSKKKKGWKTGLKNLSTIRYDP